MVRAPSPILTFVLLRSLSVAIPFVGLLLAGVHPIEAILIASITGAIISFALLKRQRNAASIRLSSARNATEASDNGFEDAALDGDETIPNDTNPNDTRPDDTNRAGAS